MNFLQKLMKTKKIISVCLASLLMMFGSSGCVPKEEWILKCGDVTINSGEYVFALTSQLFRLNSQLNQSEDMFSKNNNKNFNLKKLMESKVKGVPAFEVAKNEALKQAKRWLVSKVEVKNNGLNSTAQSKMESDFDYADFDDEISYHELQYNASKWGLSKQTFYDYIKNNHNLQATFENNFAEGKPYHVTEEEIKNFVLNNFVKFKEVQIVKDGSNSVYFEEKTLDGENNEKENDSESENEKKNVETISKLEKFESVKTPEELMEKFKKEFEDGAKIEDIAKRMNKITNSSNKNVDGEEKEEEFEITSQVKYNLPDEDIGENSKYSYDLKLVKFVANNMQVDEKVEFYEDEMFYHFLQRCELNDDDIKQQMQMAQQIYLTKKIDEFFNKKAEEFKVEQNDKLINGKYSSKNQAEILNKIQPQMS